MSQPNQPVRQNLEDDKDLDIFVENPTHGRDGDAYHDLKATEFSENQLKSELDTLPLMKSIWAFRRVFLLCTIAGFTASTDGQYSKLNDCALCSHITGFQNQISGSILANRGFINHVSNGQYYNAKTGNMALNPLWVSVFNGIFRCVVYHAMLWSQLTHAVLVR
jgi:hypothetical protein